MDARHLKPEEIRDLIFESDDFIKLAETAGCSTEKIIKMLFEAGKVLDFNPGRRFMPPSRYVIPEIIIHDNGIVLINGAVIILDEEKIELVKGISNSAKIARQEGKVARARMLENAVNQRYSIMKKIIKLVIKKQEDFIFGRSDVLKSLLMKDVAKEIFNDNGRPVVSATISKAVAEKYVQMPWGDVVAFGSLFDDSGIDTKHGRMSEGEIKQRMRQIYEAEDKNNPLEDQDEVDMLNKDGIPVKLRTVTKYRNEMGFDSAKGRKNS